MSDPASQTDARLPRHVAVIMDGNGRWARRRGLPRHAGHRAGLKAARAVIRRCGERGVEALTLFAFSSENWDRPGEEVARLMELFLRALNEEVPALHENGVRLRFIGERSSFGAELQAGMREAEALTAANAGLKLQIAAGYGGRRDILAAARRVAERVAAGSLAPEALDERELAAGLALAGLPEPDLFIRTGGERRISNFLLWDLAYTELYFCDTLWPDFDPAALDAALDWYAGRERRFGRTSEQLESRHA